MFFYSRTSLHRNAGKNCGFLREIQPHILMATLETMSTFNHTKTLDNLPMDELVDIMSASVLGGGNMGVVGGNMGVVGGDNMSVVGDGNMSVLGNSNMSVVGGGHINNSLDEEFDTYQSGNDPVNVDEQKDNLNLSSSVLPILPPPPITQPSLILPPPPHVPPESPIPPSAPKTRNRKLPHAHQEKNNAFGTIQPISTELIQDDDTRFFYMVHGHYIGFVTNIAQKSKPNENPSVRGSIHVGLRHEVVCHPEIQNATIRITAFQEVIDKEGEVLYGHDVHNQNSRFIYCTTWRGHEFMLPAPTIQVYDRAVTEMELEVFMKSKYPLPAQCHKCHNPLELA